MKGFLSVVQGLLLVPVILGVMAWQWILYWLGKGSKPTPQDFS